MAGKGWRHVLDNEYHKIETLDKLNKFSCKVQFTTTGLYMYYASTQSEYLEVGTIKTLVKGAKIVYSTEGLLNDNIKKNVVK